MREWNKNNYFHTSLGLRSRRADSAFSMSENFVAPSASAIRMSFPLQIIVPFNGAEQGTKDNGQNQHLFRCIWVLRSSRQQLNIFGLTIRTAPPFPLFFTNVMTRTLSGPYSLVYCNATWTNNGTSQSLFFCHWMSNTFPAKKRKKKSPQWFGLCCHHWRQLPHR